MFSTDGVCHTFGKDGDGYVPAEGIGAVLLKPAREAVKDGDRIYAVIKGSAVNHVGTVSGISVPSPVAQADLIEECLDKAGIDPRTASVSFILRRTGRELLSAIRLRFKALSRRSASTHRTNSSVRSDQ